MLGFGRSPRRKIAEQERKELREVLMKHAETSRVTEEAKTAIDYCIYNIKEYEKWFYWNETRWIAWQRVVVVGGVIATLAGVITLPSPWINWISEPHQLSWLRGVPAGIVTIAAGYLSSFTYREDAVRHELTAHALWNELAKYVGKADPYNTRDEASATSDFLKTICLMVEAESRSWSALVTNITTDKDRSQTRPED